jgi:hypothetical protein
MLRRYWPLAGLAGTIAVFAGGPAIAQSVAQEINDLRDQVQALQRKIQQLEGRVAKTDKTAPSPSTNVVAAKAPAPAPTGRLRLRHSDSG